MACRAEPGAAAVWSRGGNAPEIQELKLALAEATVRLRIRQKGSEYIDQAPSQTSRPGEKQRSCWSRGSQPWQTSRAAATGAASPSSAPVTNVSGGHGRHQRSTQRVLDLDDLRAGRGVMDVVNADDYVICEVPAPIAVVTGNGPCFRGVTFADAFADTDADGVRRGSALLYWPADRIQG